MTARETLEQRQDTLYSELHKLQEWAASAPVTPRSMDAWASVGARTHTVTAELDAVEDQLFDLDMQEAQ